MVETGHGHQYHQHHRIHAPTPVPSGPSDPASNLATSGTMAQMPSMSSLLCGSSVINSTAKNDMHKKESPVDCVHNNNTGVLALGGSEVLEQGQLDAAIVVVREIVHSRMAHPVVQHLLERSAADNSRMRR